MCEHNQQSFDSEHPCASATATPQVGSRRRRLWDLAGHCHCPVVGVCMPLDALRKLVNKAVGGETVADDYTVHVGVVAECAVRNRLSEALQADLDRRYAPVIRRFGTAKSVEAVARLWVEAIDAGDVAGAFWAAITHPRCDGALQEVLCRDIHMIQHQAGAAVRADLKKVRALIEENGVLSRELGRVQQRSTQWQAERIAEHERLSSQLVRIRGESIAKDTVIEMLRHELAELREARPDPRTNAQLAQRNADLLERVRGLERKLAEVHRVNLLREAVPPMPEAVTERREADVPAEPMHLGRQNVLCVGGRSGHIPIYRDWVERHGGRFAHHDGGIEDSPHRLDASLAAADLVVCQTGCLSHNAYWLVKDHCKRTGKRCVYVDKPSIAGFVRSLAQVRLPAGPALVDTSQDTSQVAGHAPQGVTHS